MNFIQGWHGQTPFIRVNRAPRCLGNRSFCVYLEPESQCGTNRNGFN